MNERIKQLAEQAEEYIEFPMPDEVYHMGDDVFRKHKSFNRERFAELIVQECIDTVKKRFMGDLNREDMEIQRCIEDLKKHFGVEE